MYRPESLIIGNNKLKLFCFIEIWLEEYRNLWTFRIFKGVNNLGTGLDIGLDLKSIFTELGINPARPFREQKPNSSLDRKTLNDVVLDIIGLTQDERNEVYWSVCELVKNRLEKARSV